MLRFLAFKTSGQNCLLRRTCKYKAGPVGECGTILPALALASALTKETDTRREEERTSFCPDAGESRGTSFAAYLLREAPARRGVRWRRLAPQAQRTDPDWVPSCAKAPGPAQAPLDHS